MTALIRPNQVSELLWDIAADKVNSMGRDYIQRDDIFGL